MSYTTQLSGSTFHSGELYNTAEGWYFHSCELNNIAEWGYFHSRKLYNTTELTHELSDVRKISSGKTKKFEYFQPRKFLSQNFPRDRTKFYEDFWIT